MKRDKIFQIRVRAEERRDWLAAAAAAQRAASDWIRVVVNAHIRGRGDKRKARR